MAAVILLSFATNVDTFAEAGSSSDRSEAWLKVPCLWEGGMCIVGQAMSVLDLHMCRSAL